MSLDEKLSRCYSRLKDHKRFSWQWYVLQGHISILVKDWRMKNKLKGI